MMSSKDPSFLGAIGEGGLKGLEAYGKSKKEREEQILGLLKEEGDIYASEARYGTSMGQLGVSAFDKAAKILEPNYTGLERSRLLAALRTKYPDAKQEDLETALNKQYLLAVEALAARMQGTDTSGVKRPSKYGGASDFVEVGQK